MTISDGITLNTMAVALQAEALAGSPSSPDETLAPRDILEFLASLRLLSDVPFNTLVPDAELLPNESIRFFFLDRAWTDALVQGALSVATTNSIERAQLEKLYPAIEAEVDDTERQIRAPGSEPRLGGEAGLVTGFLMRSAAVAGWPGLHVRAYAKEPGDHDEEILPENHSSRIKLLRLERLAPSVLLALLDGAPSVIHIEEPRQGVQFGTRLSDDGDGKFSASVPARNVRSALYVDDSGNEIEPASVAQGQSPSELANDIPVRFRSGAAGVIDMTLTARAFRDANGTDMTGTGDERIDGAEFAMQMMRFPYRQVFAQSETTVAIQQDAFVPSLGGTANQATSAISKFIDES